jgi:acetate kinase
MQVLALDPGSSTLKYALIDVNAPVDVDAPVIPNAPVILSLSKDARERADALRDVLSQFRDEPLRPDAIGHRIVFGGSEHVQPERITESTIAGLQAVSALDPLHAPLAVATIRAAQAAFPEVPQVACYDTAFHATLPDAVKHFPLPKALFPEIRRFGYHGLSYEYIVSQLGDRANGRVVAAHLGNGASVAAIVDGRSVDTSMGLTPLGGIMMGTRPGDLDPGVILRLLQDGRSVDEVADILTNRSGLLGISGTTKDMRELLAGVSAGDRGAALAIEMFALSACKCIAAMAASMRGIDRVVFTGGIGEHSPQIRALICGGLAHIGIALDETANHESAETISAHGARVPVHVIPTNEALMVARHTANVLG